MLSGKERPNGHEYFIDVRSDLYVDVSTLSLRRIGPGVVEIWGELCPPQYNLRNFVCLGFVE